MREPGEDRGRHEEGGPVESEDRQIRPGLVHRESETPEERTQGDTHVRDRAQVGLERHSPTAGRDPGDVPGPDGAGAPVEERLDGEDEDQSGERPRDQEAQRRHTGGGGEPEQYLARAANIAEVAERDLAEQRDRGGHRESRADLGWRQPDDVGEVQGGGRHERPVAHRVHQRGDGENPQCRVDGDPAAGQSVALLGGRHRLATISRYQDNLPASEGGTRQLSGVSSATRRGVRNDRESSCEALAGPVRQGLQISPRHRFAGGGPRI
jgi:hypothetical protein